MSRPNECGVPPLPRVQLADAKVPEIVEHVRAFASDYFLSTSIGGICLRRYQGERIAAELLQQHAAQVIATPVLAG